MPWGCKIDMVHDLSDMVEDLKLASEVGIYTLAHDIHKELVDRIEQGDQSWPPSSEVTKWLKGGEKPLVNSGDFKKAIEIRVDKQTAYVGILSPFGNRGQDMEMIARVIEGGAIIPVTDKMRGWFAARGFPLRKTTAAIIIPARPVFGPSIATLEEKVDEVFGPLLDEIGIRSVEF